MVIITEISKINEMNEKDFQILAKLQSKDKFIILADNKSSLSILALMGIMDMKIKPDFRIIDLKNPRMVGSIIGYEVALNVKEKEIIILSNDDFFTGAKNVKCVTSLSGVATKKSAPVSTKTENSEKKAVKEPVAAVVKEAVKPASLSRTRTKLKDMSNESLIAKYEALEPYRDAIMKCGTDTIKKAISEAEDAEIGFKFKLMLYLGDNASEEVWKILKKDFAKLKAMV